MQFSRYLKLCRKRYDLTQEQLVYALYNDNKRYFKNLEAGTLGKWERGVTQPKVSKQVSIIKYFQKITGVTLPCWDHYTTEEVENLICKAGIYNLVQNGEQLILTFPSKMMSNENLHVYPVKNHERMGVLLELNMDIHIATTHEYAQISIKQFTDWALHPSNLFLACEYKGGFLGLFFTIRLKPEVFDKLINFKIHKCDITVDDFASFDEIGCNYMLSFYAANTKVATMLFGRYYAHLIAHQESIFEIGVSTTLDEVKKVVDNMNLHHCASKTTDDHIEIHSYRQTLSNILTSKNTIKMILSKHTCPEE